MTTQPNVLVTGASGMIGTALVQALAQAGYAVTGIDRKEASVTAENYVHYSVDMADKAAVESVFARQPVTHVIHLAALAHAAGETDLSYERYYQVNVLCARHVFESAATGRIPVLLISTVDVYGFTKETVSGQSPTCPVSVYAKTKLLAEQALREVCRESVYSIYRFAPVYTQQEDRDIRKRYYLCYPSIAYQIGRGMEYEVLGIGNAVTAMVQWVASPEPGAIRNIKDDQRMCCSLKIQEEKAQNRARIVLRFPYWLVKAGFLCLMALTGKNRYTYLLNKAVSPLRTE